MWTWASQVRTAGYAIVSTGLGVFGLSEVRAALSTGMARTRYGGWIHLSAHPVVFWAFIVLEGVFATGLIAIGLVAAWSFVFPGERQR